MQKAALKNFGIITEKYLCQSLFFDKACNFIKGEAPAQVFSCEYWEIFKDTFFEEHLRTAASEITFLLFIRFFLARNFSSKFVSNLHFTKSDL